MPEIDPALLFRLVICFLAGSIPFAVLAMRGTGLDIRQIGSGNPGFNNVLRVSKWRAAMTLAGDLGKGLLAVGLCRQPGESALLGWLYGFAAVGGHCYSPWLRFNGGKGIATSAGVMLVLYPAWATAAVGLYTALRVTARHFKWKESGMIASLSSWALFTVLLLVFLGRNEGSLSALMTGFLAWRHKKNFQNLLAPA